MSAVSSPYRFVPLSRLVLFPDWGSQVSHDQPFADGVCGELKLRLTSHTPLCVGGEQVKASSENAGEVRFFRTPAGRPAIPGSSLKGMLRNVLEIAAFARFSQVEDKRLGVRDISESNNFYCREMVKVPVKAGWLRFADGAWSIQPCEFSRLHQESLIASCNIDKGEWKKAKTASRRYELIGICPPLRFEREAATGKLGQWLALPAQEGRFSGSIVVTGQPGPAFDEGTKSKKFEFVFHDTDAESIPVRSEVMTGFRQIHETSDEWADWMSRLAAGKLPRGIPVFFHPDGEQVKSLGLAMMYKLPYSNSLHDAIRHTHDAHLSDARPDLADLIFGHLGEHNSLRGRINIGLATLTDDCAGHAEMLGPCVLNGPKPTFYPAYVRQDGNKGTFRQLMEPKSELAGWKRYPAKRFIRLPPPPEKSKPSVQVKLETLPVNSTFTGIVRFHNLRRVELGALLWALDFGGRPSLRHGLGMGKSFGLGQVSLAIEGQRLRSNDPTESCEGREAEYLHACRMEFIDLMDQTLVAAGLATSWEQCDPIRALLEQAKPAASSTSLDYLPDPKAFVQLRKAENLDEIKQVFHERAGISPANEFDTTQARGYESRFSANLEQAGDQVRRQAERSERAERIASASQEDALLLEIEGLQAECLKDSATRSQKDNLAKQLLRGCETFVDMSAEQKQTLRSLAEQCEQIEVKKIRSACKKILRDVA